MEIKMNLTNTLQQENLPIVNVSISLKNDIISRTKYQFNESEVFEKIKDMDPTCIDCGNTINDTRNGDQNITKPLSKDRSLIWIGSYAINSERVAIFILFAGLLFLLALILQSWRRDVINKRKYKQYRKAQQDLPPTYSELVLNKNPPEYKESLMQVLIGQ